MKYLSRLYKKLLDDSRIEYEQIENGRLGVQEYVYGLMKHTSHMTRGRTRHARVLILSASKDPRFESLRRKLALGEYMYEPPSAGNILSEIGRVRTYPDAIKFLLRLNKVLHMRELKRDIAAFKAKMDKLQTKIDVIFDK